jgi:outer membrane protein
MRRFSALIFVLAISTAALETAGADLLSTYRDAQSADAVYASARAAYEAGKEILPQGLAGLLPTVSVAANTQYNDRNLSFRGPATGVGGTAQFNTNSVNVVATQPLFNYQNWITYQQAKDQVSQAEAQFLQVSQDLIVRVAQAYFDLLLAEDNVALAAAQKAAIGEQLAQAKRNFEVGTATITDANDAQARYDLTVSQEIAAQNDLEVKRQALQQIIGKPVLALAKVGSNFPLTPPTPNNMDQWVEQAMNSSLQIRIAQANLDFADKSVSLNRAGHLPTLNAIASYVDSGAGSGVQGGSGVDSTTKFVGLQLALPVYQGGLVSSRVRQALANLDKARQDLENARRTVAFNTKQAFLGVTNGMAQVRALQAALVSSQSSLDSSKLGQEVGVRTQVDVLNSTQQLITTRRDYAQTVYNYIMSALKLKSAAGTLSDDDLAYINTGLEK